MEQGLESDPHPESLQLSVQRRGTPSSSQSYQFDQGFAVIGSGDFCQLRLDDPGIPTRALYLQRLTDRVVFVLLEDYAAAEQYAGVVSPPRRAIHTLLPRVAVSLGPYEIWHSTTVPGKLLDEGGVNDQPLAAFTEPVAEWEISNGKSDNSARRSRHIRHALTLVGRGALCRFRMVHSSISEVHASLVVLHGELHVIDLCSDRGLCVNGRRVSQSRLHDGDELSIGQCHGVIRWRGVPELEPASQPVLLPSHATEDSLLLVAEHLGEDGIVVSLSSAEPPVRHIPTAQCESGLSDLQPVNETQCLALVTQFLEMQQSVLDQTQLLMEKISERLQTGAPPQNEPEIGPLTVSQASRVESPPSLEPAEPDLPATPPRRKKRAFPKPTDAALAPAPEFHGWLTRQLHDLEASQQSGFSRLWQRLTGLK